MSQCLRREGIDSYPWYGLPSLWAYHGGSDKVSKFMAYKKWHLLPILLFAVGCSTGRNRPDIPECYEVINATASRIAPHPKIYFKSFEGREYGADFIRSQLRSLVIAHVREDIYREGIRKIDSMNRISTISHTQRESEVDSIAQRYLTPLMVDFLSEQEVAELADSRSNGLIWDKARLDKRIQVSHSKTGSALVSTPLFTESHRKAVYFVEVESAMQLMLCEKDATGNWQYYAAALVWIE